MNKLNIALALSFIAACNVKGVECSQEDVSCIKTDVNSDVDVSETNTTVNNTIVNNSGGSGGSNNDSSGGSAGSDVGPAGSGGSSAGASNTSDNDAGVGDSGASVPLVCDSATALPNDVRNWFATNLTNDEWFQLITPDGFSEDRCIYTGKIRWFYQGVDGFWESDREHDEPYTTFKIEFELNGDVKINLHTNNSGYTAASGMNVYYDGQCGPPRISEGDPSITITCSKDYRIHECFKTGAPNCHDLTINAFRAIWDETLERPVTLQTIYPGPWG